MGGWMGGWVGGGGGGGGLVGEVQRFPLHKFAKGSCALLMADRSVIKESCASRTYCMWHVARGDKRDVRQGLAGKHRGRAFQRAWRSQVHPDLRAFFLHISAGLAKGTAWRCGLESPREGRRGGVTASTAPPPLATSQGSFCRRHMRSSRLGRGQPGSQAPAKLVQGNVSINLGKEKSPSVFLGTR